ncbi:MAG: sugar phosphate isomerase/epimerase family protein [Mobilitalea sp.]
MEFGVQIFGCLAECKKNPDAFFKALAEAGYKQIEPCILFDDPVKMVENARIDGNEFMERLADNIWKPNELPEYIQIMEQYGLKLSSVHVFANNINQVADNMIETAKKNNINAYIVNCNQQTIALEYEVFANECSNLSSTLKEHGIELWIHNNGAELKTMVEYNCNQVPVLSAILDLSKKANVGAQIDVGWVLFAGIDPVKYLQEVKEYVRSIHFKDLKRDFEIRRDGDIFACLGDGALNVKEILEWIPQNSGISVLIDQDASDGDIMDDIIKSYHVLCEASQ